MENNLYNNDLDDPLSVYLKEKILPLAEEANRLKECYRSQFWCCFWTVISLFCAYGIFVLFRSIIYNQPISIMKTIILLIAAPLIIAYPLWDYSQEKQKDIFGIFLQFYGDWKHQKEKKETSDNVDSPILPKHETAQIVHRINGSYAGTDIEIFDTEYFIKQKKKNSGVEINLRFSHNINNEIVLLEKAFIQRKKPAGMNCVDEQIYIPAAGYFNIFSSDKNISNNLLCSAFFESILAIKENFGARKMSVWLKDNQIKIYFDNYRTYFDHSNIWSKKIDQTHYHKLNQQFESIFHFVEIMQEILARDIL